MIHVRTWPWQDLHASISRFFFLTKRSISNTTTTVYYYDYYLHLRLRRETCQSYLSLMRVSMPLYSRLVHLLLLPATDYHIHHRLRPSHSFINHMRETLNI